MEADIHQRCLERERRARHEAERLLEAKSLELFTANEELRKAAAELDRKRQMLQDAFDREKEINGLQRQFVSMVSHEFRTPLAIIDGNAQRILRRSSENLTKPQNSALQKIRNAVRRLTELMESVLSVARLEDGRIDLDPQSCSLRDIIQDITGSYGEIYADRKFNLDLDGLPDQIIADHSLLRQVFSNLLSNAVKYSPGTINIWIDGWTDNQARAVIAVRDEGLGIPETDQANLFQRFFRASTSVGIAGTGIGLHLAAHLVHLHNGSIELESTEGKGSTFRVLLPTTATSCPKDSKRQEETETATP